ncbi:ATP-binding protein [Nannocystis pusilla]|uniref:histidine kinase n=1 Tax=Nannocystis pusilla TaxID=889268 RepID=A0A9X3J2R8_9BACT|nr:ATP-binding protein [Nannocystis pusilla]
MTRRPCSRSASSSTAWRSASRSSTASAASAGAAAARPSRARSPSSPARRSSCAATARRRRCGWSSTRPRRRRRSRSRPGEFTSALINLIGNALDAVETTGTVTVRTGAGAGGAYVEVVDDGPGIAAEVQAHMLEPFFTTKAEGTGLGLAIVRGFVDRHGGKLSFETAPGAGTCVRMVPDALAGSGGALEGAAGAASGMP